MLKVLNTSENQVAKPLQSQVYRPISLNLLRQKIVRTIRRLFCTSQMSSGLFTSMLSYCKITMPRKVCHNLISAIAFFNLGFPPQVLLSLGLTTFLETQSIFIWMNRALISPRGSPSPGNELKRFFRSGSRKSGKFMVDSDFINPEI